jgi:hypothetical protein
VGKVLAAALAVTFWLGPVGVAGAHSGHEHAGTPSPAARAGAVDPAEVAELGEAHAAAHAKARALEQLAGERWARLTPAQRERRIARTARQTRALNASLAGGRDDVGYWDQTLYPLPEYAINAIALPTSKILIFGREPVLGGTGSNLGSARLFDPSTGRTSHVPPPPIPENQGRPAPIFCSGQTLLSDGRVLIAGGNLSTPGPGRPHYSGLDYTFIFDPWSQTWETGPRMTHGRWYPTLTRLASGDVLIAGGLDENGQGLRNGRLDIWRPGDTASTPLQPFPGGSRADPGEIPGETLPPSVAFGLSTYPYMYTLPDGNVALAGPGRQDSAILDTGVALDRNAAPGSAWTQTGSVPDGGPAVAHQGGTGAIEPDLGAFAGSWNLLAMAGADEAGVGFHLARKTVERFDAHPGVLGWTSGPDLNRARFYLNNVLLPDGGIVVVGGGVGADYRTAESPGNYYLGTPAPPAGQQVPDPPAQLKQVELRRAGERTWRLGAAQQEWRTYHSTAWLLPDGRIVSAGDDGNQKLVASRDDAEIYWPPYLFDGDACALRPVIRGVGAPGPPAPGARAWATLTYGERFGVFSEHAQPGMQAVLVAPAATTHGVDMNQRLVPLAVEATVAAGGLNVTMPAAAPIAPPGYYMLFVVDPDGTPSEARWVHVLPAAQAAAERGGAVPATVAGAWPGPRGRSCANPDGSQRSEPDPVGPSSTAGGSPPPARPVAKGPAKLGLERAAIRRSRRALDMRARISALASGRVGVVLSAAGRRTRMTAAIDRKRRRIVVDRRIPAAQARLGTGILTLTYKGNAATRPQSVRLRAAAAPAGLRMRRPTLTAGGRLRAAGTISARARGKVRVQLQFERAGRTRTLEFPAPIRRGSWKLDKQLPRSVRDAIAARTGTVHSYTLFTGYRPARMRGEMRSYELLGAR